MKILCGICRPISCDFRLCSTLTKINAQAQEVANLAWAAAVLQSLDPALLCWIWRAIDLQVGAMSNTELSQVRAQPYKSVIFGAKQKNLARAKVLRQSKEFAHLSPAIPSSILYYYYIQEKLTDLCGNLLLHNDFINTVASAVLPRSSAGSGARSTSKWAQCPTPSFPRSARCRGNVARER